MKLWFERGAWASRGGRKKIERMSRADVKHIVVIRHAALGDMILVRPFLIELRHFFPESKITLSIVSNYTYGAPTELVDSIHVVKGSDQQNVRIIDLFTRARELGQVDMLFDLADTTRSRYLCLLTKAKIKIGFPYRNSLRRLLFDAAVFRSDFAFESCNMLDTLMLLGAKPQFPLNFGWVGDQHRVDSREIGNVILYFPFASINSKCWPRQRFIELIRTLSRQLSNYRHIVLGGITPAESLHPYRGSLNGLGNVFFNEAASLVDTIRLIRSAELLISNDTGIRNLAIGLDIPTVGIFFSTVPYRYWPPWGRHEVVCDPNGFIPDVESVSNSVMSVLSRSPQ